MLEYAVGTMISEGIVVLWYSIDQSFSTPFNNLNSRDLWVIVNVLMRHVFGGMGVTGRREEAAALASMQGYWITSLFSWQVSHDPGLNMAWFTSGGFAVLGTFSRRFRTCKLINQTWTLWMLWQVCFGDGFQCIIGHNEWHQMPTFRVELLG